MATVGAEEQAIEALRTLPTAPAWLFVEAWSLTPGQALDPIGPPAPLVRALSKSPALGLVRCEAACAATLDDTLGSPGERARLEQIILRGSEQVPLDGLAVDLTSLPALDEHAVDFVEELAAAAHATGRRVGVLTRMTCRGVECEGVRGTLGPVARAADVVSLEELDQDMPAIEVRQRRRVGVLALELDARVAPRVFLGVARTSDLAARLVDASARGLGGVDVGRLGDAPRCAFDLIDAWTAKRPPPPCP